MTRRLVAVVSALLLAVVGGVLLLGYVQAADRRAVADLAPVTVLVLTAPVPEGATAEQLAAVLEPKVLPGTAVVPGAVSSLAELEALVTTTALEPGEQLLRSRLVDPATLVETEEVEVPDGMQQVSVLLEQERVVGGAVEPGDTVGVFLSTGDEDSTRLALRTVLVTALTGGPAPAADGAEDGSAAAATGGLTVTLALQPENAERVVFAAEHGTIWLAADPADAPAGRTAVTTKGNLYR